MVMLAVGFSPLLAAASDDTSGSEAATVPGQEAEEATKALDSTPEPVGQAQLEVREQLPYGRYLTDADGMSLYLFEKDEPGTEVSTCYQSCAIAWPPYVTEQSPEAGEHVEGDKLGTLEREDGSLQVTYDGWPLYYFSGDKAAGDALGQDVLHVDAEWYLLSPAGEKIEKGERQSRSP
jgi:predicted lipoprotein with Yx(FWY)xxD motif